MNIKPPTTRKAAITIRIIAQMGSSDFVAGAGTGDGTGTGVGAWMGAGTGTDAGFAERC
jgi:hypothetical protein